MTATGLRGVAWVVRRRIRLRTRLRRAWQAWRHRPSRRLPPWSELPAESIPTGPQLGRPAHAIAQVRRSSGDLEPGWLAVHADPGGVRWDITRTGDGVRVVAGRLADGFDVRQARALAVLGPVGCPPDPAVPPEVWGEVVAELALTGVVLHAASPPPLTAASPSLLRTATAPPVPPELAGELAGVLSAPLPVPGADPLEWELRSLRQRRAALRRGSAAPAVSALLVTRRPERVAAAVAGLAQQTYPELEIVVGLHGFAEPAGLAAAAAGRPLRVVPVPAAQNLGEALAAVSAAATGALVTKVDDDDHYDGEHVWDLVLAHRYTGAAVVGKGAEFVYLAAKDVTVRRRMDAETFSDTVAGGTIALAPDALAAAGGWPPVPRSVDRALLDRVLAAGGAVYRTHPFGFVYTRHRDGHTWDPGPGYFRADPVRTWRGLPPYPELGAA